MRHESFKDNAHSFILKVWQEKPASKTEQAVWRGHITHVPSNQRRYIKDLREIEQFIKPYLQKLGVDID